MKKFTDKVHRLSQRAAELKHAIESVPPKIVEVRDAVTTATAHVQKLRADIISGVSTLRAETDTQLVSTLREIDGGAEVLADAGCRVRKVEMDLGPARRIVVQLERVENVDAAHVRALLNAHGAQPAIHALLSALLKADELANKVELTHLRHNQLTVEIGLIPSVRIGWGSEAAEKSVATTPTNSATAQFPAPSVSAPSTFFERRAAAVPAPSASATPAPSTATPATVEKSATPEPAPCARASGPAKHTPGSALDRFKKMPDLAKRSR